MLRQLLLTGITMSVFNASFSQDSAAKPTLTLSGFADIYYKYDFGKSKANNLTSFTNSHNSFEPGMASVKLLYKTAKLEVVGDFGAGKRAEEFSYNDRGAVTLIKQLYLSYSASSWLKLTAGSWATHVGYEQVDANLNRNYSMSYMFTNGPFFHTGVKAEAVFGKSGLMIGLANPTDYIYVPDEQINSKFLLAQYSYVEGDAFKAYLNFVGGKNVDTTRSKQFDLVLVSKLSSKFSLAYNGTVNRTTTYLGAKLYDASRSWWGSALYVTYSASKKVDLALRTEYFNDDNRLKVYHAQLKGGNIFATTLSANIKAANLVLIPEVRWDGASQAIFTSANGAAKKWAANVLLAAIYQF